MPNFLFASITPEQIRSEVDRVEQLQEMRREARYARFEGFFLLARNASNERDEKAQKKFWRLEQQKWAETIETIHRMRIPVNVTAHSGLS